MSTLTAPIAYVRDTGERPRYYANAHEKDTIVLAPVAMAIEDMRGRETSLDVEGCPRRSAIGIGIGASTIVSFSCALA